MHRRLLSGLLAIAVLTSTHVSAQEAEEVIVNPTWIELPSPEDLGDAFPSFAARLGLSGTALLKCRVTSEGRLGHCDVLRSAPEGLGFGRAALSQTPRFRLSPRTVDGEAEKSYVQFSVNFKLADDPPPRPWADPEPDPAIVAAVRAALSRMVEAMGPPPTVDPAGLGVDEDRQAEVLALIERVEGELLNQRLDAAAVQIARAASHDQIKAIIAGDDPGAPPAGFDEAGNETYALDRLAEQRVRDLYCARYPCGLSD